MHHSHQSHAKNVMQHHLHSNLVMFQLCETELKWFTTHNLSWGWTCSCTFQIQPNNRHLHCAPWWSWDLLLLHLPESGQGGESWVQNYGQWWHGLQGYRRTQVWWGRRHSSSCLQWTGPTPRWWVQKLLTCLHLLDQKLYSVSIDKSCETCCSHCRRSSGREVLWWIRCHPSDPWRWVVLWLHWLQNLKNWIKHNCLWQFQLYPW